MSFGGIKKVIPDCYEMIICNPTYEQERGRDNLSDRCVSMKTFKTDDFKSAISEDEMTDEEYK